MEFFPQNKAGEGEGEPLFMTSSQGSDQGEMV